MKRRRKLIIDPYGSPAVDALITADALLQQIDDADPMDWAIPNWVPVVPHTMLFGRPRTGKSLLLMEMAVAIATTTAAFRHSRFQPKLGRAVLYVAGEDPLGKLARERLRPLLLARQGRDASALTFWNGPSLSLDSRASVDQLIARCLQGVLFDGTVYPIGLIVLDPLSRFTARLTEGADKLKRVADALHRIHQETGAMIVSGHHDSTTRPKKSGHHRWELGALASGGVPVYGIVDAPMYVERPADNIIGVTPCGFKWSDDPDAFTVRQVIERDATGSHLRDLVVDTTGGCGGGASLEQRIVAYVAGVPADSINALARGVHARKESVHRTVTDLAARGVLQLTSVGRAHRVSLAPPAVPQSESAGHGV